MPIRPERTTSCTGWSIASGSVCASWLMTRLLCRVISPRSGSSSPPISFKVVDLPAPLRPIRQTRSPASIVIDASVRIF